MMIHVLLGSSAMHGLIGYLKYNLVFLQLIKMVKQVKATESKVTNSELSSSVYPRD